MPTCLSRAKRIWANTDRRSRCLPLRRRHCHSTKTFYPILKAGNSEPCSNNPNHGNRQSDDRYPFGPADGLAFRGIRRGRLWPRLLAQEPGIRPEDVLINLVERAKEDWSLGNGVASYAS